MGARLSPPAAACKLTGLPDCPPDVQAGCQVRIAALELAVDGLRVGNGKLEQSNRELAEAVREATEESKRRSAAIDDLASKLLVRDNGYKLLKETSESAAIPEKL
jgi:hypothetical protein